MGEIISKSVEEAKKFINLEKGDHIIITGGFNTDKTNKESTPTNLMKIETI